MRLTAIAAALPFGLAALMYSPPAQVAQSPSADVAIVAGSAQASGVGAIVRIRITLHNYLNQEIRPVAERMEIAVTARCADDVVVRVNLFWADATGFGDLAADRFSFDCRSDATRSVFSVRRPPEAKRAGLVIDAPDDAHPVVIHRVEVHPIAPVSGE